MRRNVLFVLLLGMGVVLSESQGQTKEAQEKTEPEQGQTEKTQEKLEADQGQTEEAEAQVQNGAKVISGMSILGNQEAPKSLVIVPWKSSEIGNSRDISTMLDDSRQPVDTEVFLRALRYYEIRSGEMPSDDR